MTPEDLKRIGNAASVSIAAGHDCMWTGNLLEPELWEALRIELQRRFRRSTGEVQATISIELTPSSPAQHSGRTAEQEIAPSAPAESRCEELVKALEFYADELTWADTNPKDDGRLTVLVPSPSFAEIDRGNRARAALTLKADPGNGGDAEAERLRHIVSDCAAALVSWAFISPKASVEFMEGLPKEVSLVVSGLRARCEKAEAALEDVLPMAEDKWANPDEIEEIRSARAALSQSRKGSE